VTVVDTADLADRTCRRCGAVYGDALAHRRWHQLLDERDDIEHLAVVVDKLGQSQVDGFETMSRLLRIAFARLGLLDGEGAEP
jgi:hypothetical protein